LPIDLEICSFFLFHLDFDFFGIGNQEKGHSGANKDINTPNQEHQQKPLVFPESKEDWSQLKANDVTNAATSRPKPRNKASVTTVRPIAHDRY